MARKNVPTPDKSGSSDRAVIKKYANRRLYNTATSSYITLEELCSMVRMDQEFVVFDAKSGEDITRSVLTQIILEEDGRGRNLLPISFLRQLIGLYDDSLQAVVPRYLELSMENFTKNQDQMREYMEQTFGKFFKVTGSDQLKAYEDLSRQNMQLFQSAMSLFSPFGDPVTGELEPSATKQHAVAQTDTDQLDQDIIDLKDQVAQLKKEIAKLTNDPSS